jgi:Flp pilus assembly protein TadD
MRTSTFFACVLVGAAFLVSGCTTNPVDVLSTTSITPPAKDISADDLSQGKAQFRDGNYGLAEKHFRQAVELRSDNAEAWMGLAACYDELGRFDFADRAYDQLVKIAGRRPRIVNNMGYSQLLRGNKTKARALFMEAERRLPGDKLVAANIALLGKG